MLQVIIHNPGGEGGISNDLQWVMICNFESILICGGGGGTLLADCRSMIMPRILRKNSTAFIGRSRGCHWHAPPSTGSNSFIFTYAFAKKCPHQRSAPPPMARRPPMGNPGSATGIHVMGDDLQSSCFSFWRQGAHLICQVHPLHHTANADVSEID